MNFLSKMRGISLIPFWITIGIIMILAMTILPNYIAYLRESEFLPTIIVAMELKPVVANCIIQNHGLSECSEYRHGIPGNRIPILNQPGVSVIKGIITATAPPLAHHGVAGSTYILIPTYTDDIPEGWHLPSVYTPKKVVTWEIKGTGCIQDYADC